MEPSFSFLSLFFAVLPIFLLMFMGAYYRYKGTLDAHADATLFWLVIHVFTPCLILDSFLGNRALENAANLLIAPILGFSTVLIGMAIAAVAAYAIGLTKLAEKRAFLSCVSLYNYGYIPIPIILLFFPKDILGMLFIFNVGLELALWTVVFMTIVGKTSLQDTLKRVCTPPLMAIVFSLGVNCFYDGNPMPASLARIVHMVGQGTIPLALLVIGATIFDHAPIVYSKGGWGPVVCGTVLRIAVIPAVFVAMAYFLPIPGQLKTVLCVQAGMPSAVLPIIFIRRHGGDLQMAIRIIVITSILSLITMPIWLSMTLS
jgi:malate permease and related proteins